MSVYSTEMLLILGAGIIVGLGVPLVSIYQTLRLLRARRGGLAAAAFAVFLAWIPFSLLALFFLSMFGSAQVAAMHAREAGAEQAAVTWARGLGIGYPLAGGLVLWLLFRLGRAARAPGG